MAQMEVLFDPESRQLQTARLKHLLTFSDLVILVIGEAGLGKTRLLHQLSDEERALKPSWVQLQLDDGCDVTRLLTTLVAKLALNCPPDNRSRLTALHAYAKSLHELGERLRLVIDDADFLTDNALELLINFSRVDQFAPQVMLAGLAEFETRFYERDFNTLVEGKLHIERLLPFTPEESAQFLRAHLDAPQQLKESEIKRAVFESQGRPGRLMLAASQLNNRELARPPRLPSRWYLGSIAAVVILMGGVLIYLWLPDWQSIEAEDVTERVLVPLPDPIQASIDNPTEVVAVRSELSERLSEQEARLLAQVDESPVETGGEDPAADLEQPTEAESRNTVSTNSAPVSNDQSLSSPEPQTGVNTSGLSNNGAPEPVQSAPGSLGIESSDASGNEGPGGTSAANPESSGQTDSNPNPVQVSPSGPPDVEPEVTSDSVPPQVDLAVRPEARAGANPTLAQSEETAPSAVSQRSAEITEVLSWPERDLTIQLLAARERSTADRFMAQYDNLNGLLLLEYPHRGTTRYLVVYRHFSSRGDAEAAVAALPEALRQLNPWIRSVAGLQIELGSS